MLGRYLGLLATTSLNLLVMAVVFVVVLAIYTARPRLPGRLAAPAWCCWRMVVQFAMVAAVATFFSAFTTTTLAAIFTLSMVVAGHLASDLVRYWSTKGVWAGRLGTAALRRWCPTWRRSTSRRPWSTRTRWRAPSPSPASATGVCYAAAVLAFAAAVFSRRDLR